MNVTIETDATPLVRIFAVKFAAALQQPDYVSLVKKTLGKFSLKSKTDPQAITVSASAQNLHIYSGVDKTSDIVIHVNFSKPKERPKIDGLFRHPLYAIAVGKMLDFPEINWADGLKQLWDKYKDYPGMPAGITVKCLDEDRQMSLGGATDSIYLEGRSADLAEVFSGGSPLLQLLFAGKIKGTYSFQHVVVMSDVTLQMMLGEA